MIKPMMISPTGTYRSRLGSIMVLELAENRSSSTLAGLVRYPSTAHATAAPPPATAIAGTAATFAALAATTSGGAAWPLDFADVASGARSYKSSAGASASAGGGGGAGMLITYPHRHFTFFPIHSGLG